MKTKTPRKTIEEHPFFCEKKKCRKTAWDTPEYLTVEDWETLKKVVAIIKSGDAMAFYRFVVKDANSKAFFYRGIGWPEGFSYCKNLNYCTQTAFVALTSTSGGSRVSDLEKIERAIIENNR